MNKLRLIRISALISLVCLNTPVMSMTKSLGAEVGMLSGVCAAWVLESKIPDNIHKEKTAISLAIGALLGAFVGYARYTPPTVRRIAQRRLAQLSQSPLLKIDTKNSQECIKHINILYGGKAVPAHIIAINELEYLRSKAFCQEWDIIRCLPGNHPDYFKLHNAASDLQRNASDKKCGIKQVFSSEIKE